MTLFNWIFASLCLLIIGISLYWSILYLIGIYEQVLICFRCPFMQGKTSDEHESESIG